MGTTLRTPSTALTPGLSATLANWCALFEGCTRIEALEPRQQATALGVIERLRLIPGESIEVIVHDGTGRLRASWNESQSPGGLELGRGLRLQGTVSREGSVPLMRNPTWCLVRDPYSCSGERA